MVSTLIAVMMMNEQGKEIDSAFWSVESRVSVTSSSMVRQEGRLYLFKNGVAVSGFYQAGVDSLDLASIKRDDRYGAWTKSGGKLNIKWGGGFNPQSFTLGDTGYTGDSTTWRPLKSVDGIKLNALFAREDPKNDGCQLMLRKDGTFTFRNAHRINLIDLSKVAPDNGSGSYVIRNWTLYLKYSGGQTASLSLELPHTQNADNAEFIHLATQNFYRWPGQLASGGSTTAAPTSVQEKIGALSFKRSSGWARSDDSQTGVSTLSAPYLPKDVLCSVSFVPAQDYKGSGEEWHSALWGPLTQGVKTVGGAKSEKVGVFTRSWTKLDRGEQGPLWISIYTVTAKGKGYVVMFATNRQDLFEPLLPEVEAMMATAKLN